jgi:4'-phosphopantetheinyl transferase
VGSAPAARPAHVDLWIIDATAVDVPAAWLAALEAGDRERAGRFHDPALRRCFVAHHVALRRILATFVPVAPSELRIERQPTGRPFVVGGPHFSMSRRAALAAVAVSRAAEVGVDLELVGGVGDGRRVADGLFTAVERAWMTEATGAGADAVADERFLAIWTAREAIAKLSGAGVDALRAVAVEPRGGALVAAAAPGGGLPRLVHLRRGAALIALATPGPIAVDVHDWPW